MKTVDRLRQGPPCRNTYVTKDIDIFLRLQG